MSADPAPRGRLPAAARADRRDAILDAAEALLAEAGYAQTTMAEIARRAGASKGTLNGWFGGREGLLAAVMERNADRAAIRVTKALEAGGPPRTVLTGFAEGLLGLLTGPSSVALNRAAMGTPELAALLLASGRHRIGPLVEGYLARLAGDGVLALDDAGEAFTMLYGLVIRDTQIRVLLGEPQLGPAARKRQAATAVEAFLTLYRSKTTAR
ncbi:TetR/AcrR family transcriptional regulator [Pontivivens ytuae]|uniref:TetR/AcrR family transcriptional regulator n=1 Tax=Pontivivens ytuae TaxID=2789856 RepID=A0A7S9LS71_9RHOB|nr:TetR/AcrR family transcriptional regulator [Pontivivens ytuae]QPH53760.1 TetR/AcrR family transcriptional regulator [Pontivivens ytuae]